MEIKMMAAVILVCLASGATGQVWHSYNASSDWKCQSVRKQINTTLIAATLDSVSLVGCCHHCARLTTTSSDVKLVSLYFDVDASQCYCNSEADVNAEDETQPELKYCMLDMSLKIDKTADDNTRRTLWPRMRDCHSLNTFYTGRLEATGAGFVDIGTALTAKAGVHVIYPDGKSPVDVWCYHRFTFIQRRLGGTENFTRNWAEYVNGFGDTTGEYWLGLKYLHLLTKVNTALRIELRSPLDGSSQMPATEYLKFTVGNESSKYVFRYQNNRVRRGYSAVVHKDFFRGQRKLRFSTFDDDNDESERNIAAETQSGWWIGNISESNPNSPYTDDNSNGSTARKGFRWSACYDYDPDWSVYETRMTIHQSDFCRDSHCTNCCL